MLRWVHLGAAGMTLADRLSKLSTRLVVVVYLLILQVKIKNHFSKTKVYKFVSCGFIFFYVMT